MIVLDLDAAVRAVCLTFYQVTVSNDFHKVTESILA